MPVATVSLNAIRSNLAIVRTLIQPGTLLMPALKADAYGHGAQAVARALEADGISWFAVATPEELLSLRDAGVSANLLLLTPVLEMTAQLAAADAAFSLADYPTLERLIGWKMPRGTRLHLKVDTGLGRLGLPPATAAGLAAEAERAGFTVEAVWTHFAAAEDDPEFTTLQLERFDEAISLLKRAGIEPRLRHASNSAATMLWPQAHFDMVRPGILCYGYTPLPDPHPAAELLTPALTLTAPVTMTKRIKAGTALSYNQLWRAETPTNILSVRCGYADGYRRLLSNRAWAALNGRRLPQRGQIAMDQILLDAGDLEVSVGERVTLLGGDGPGADELGRLAGSNAYDILTSLGRRIKRTWS